MGSEPPDFPSLTFWRPRWRLAASTCGWLLEMVRRAGGRGSEHSSASVSLVCKWRAGQVIPGPNHVRLVAQAFDLPVEVVAAAAAAQRRPLLIVPSQEPTLWLHREDHDFQFPHVAGE